MSGHLRRVAARAWNPPPVHAAEGITPLSLARLVVQRKAATTAGVDPRSERGPGIHGSVEPAPPAMRRETDVAIGGEPGPAPAASASTAAPRPLPADRMPAVRNHRRTGAADEARTDGEPRRTRGPAESATATPAAADVPRSQSRRVDATEATPRPAVVVRREAPPRPSEGRRDRRPDPVVVRIGRVELTLSTPAPPAPPSPATAASSRPVVTHPDLLSAHRSYGQRGSGT